LAIPTISLSRRRPTTQARHDNLVGYLLILPWLAGFFAWIAAPMVVSLYLSFTDYNLFRDPRWVGFENFLELGRDELVLTSLANTTYYTFVGVPLYTAIALAAALLLNRRIRGIAFFRTIYYIPSIVPAVAATLIWLWIFNPDYGLANMFMRQIGLAPQRWFYDVDQAKPLLILMSLWAFGPAMVLFLAALQGVPVDLTEAAIIDGAGPWARLTNVTLPMISPVTFFNLVTGFIVSFQVFVPAYIATGGGPANATLFYVLYLYRVAIQYLKFGYAAAMAWLLFAIILALTLLQLYVSQRWVYYETAPDV
jgi:multiple sugar transport system permease protein